MLKVLIPAVGVLTMVAFAARPATPELELQESPAPMGWHLHMEGDLAKLAYGVANSDQLALMLTCEPGDTSAVVYGDVQLADARLERVAYTHTVADPMSNGEAYEARVSVDAKGLRDLANGQGIRLEGQAGMVRVGATPAEQKIVSDFLSWCGSGKV